MKQTENAASPHKCDPKFTTDDGRCLLCSDNYHMAEIDQLYKDVLAMGRHIGRMESERETAGMEYHKLEMDLEKARNDFRELTQVGPENSETMRLAAISTAATQNTPESIRDRIDETNPYWSTAYGDVCRAVDREMALRKALDIAFNALMRGAKKPSGNYCHNWHAEPLDPCDCVICYIRRALEDPLNQDNEEFQ